MKKYISLILCLILTLDAFAVTTLKAKSSLSVAGGYVTSQSKVDGSFEDGATGWSASTGSITQTASTEFQGNYKGVWTGTGTGTLDLQWVATASNTFSASLDFKTTHTGGDFQICAYVGTTETGCAAINGSDYTSGKIKNASVIADSVLGSSFYLRLKHTGSDSFSIDLDSGKIEPWNPQYVQTASGTNIIQSWQDGTEWTSYTPTFSAGFGTVTNAAGKWKRSGSDLEVLVSCTTGTVVTSLATVTIPSGLSIDANKLTINNTTSNPGNLVGTYNGSDAAIGGIGQVLTAPSTSVTVLYFGSQDSNAASHITPANGNIVVNSSKVFSFYAKVPISGWSSSSTLLALPTSKENVFSTKLDAAGAILTKSSDWLNSSTKGATGIFSIDYTKLALTSIPSITAVSQSSLGRYVEVSAISTTAATFKVYTDSGTPADQALNIILQKQSPDYTAPGVFVGTVQPDWQYDLTVTGTNWTTTRAVGVVYKMASGQYRMRFNIAGTVTGTVSSFTGTISGVVFKNIASYYQRISTETNNGGISTYTSNVIPNTATFSINHASNAVGGYSIFGDVEIESKPTWATNTP